MCTRMGRYKFFVYAPTENVLGEIFLTLFLSYNYANLSSRCRKHFKNICFLKEKLKQKFCFINLTREMRK